MMMKKKKQWEVIRWWQWQGYRWSW